MKKIYTDMANAVIAAEDDPKSDIASKMILAYKPILARILKPNIPEYLPLTYPEIESLIEGKLEVRLPTDDEIDEDLKILGDTQEVTFLPAGKTVFDLRFHCALPEDPQNPRKVLEVIVNLEAQKNIDKKYRIEGRMVNNSSGMIVLQKGTDYTNSDYQDLRKSYSIWIVTDPSAPFGGTRFPITSETLFGAPREPKGYDLIEGIILYIGREPNIIEEECTPEEWENWKKYEESVNMLRVLFSEDLTGEEKTRILEEDFSLPMTKSYSESVKAMNEYVRDVGVLKYKKGREDEKIETVRRMNQIHCSPELISVSSGVDLDTVEKWIKEMDSEN